MSLEHEEVEKILRILDASHFNRMTLRLGNLKIDVAKGVGGLLPPDGELEAQTAAVPTPAPAPAVAPVAATPQKSAVAEVPEGLVAVRAPMLGTFYHSPSPDSPPFVEVGKQVAADDTVGLMEVMKLYHSVPAGVAGTVEAVLAQDGTLVEYEQVLVVIRPSAGQ